MITPLMVQIKKVSMFQYGVARQCNITERRMSRLSNGHCRPRPEEVAALCRVLRCTPAQIFPDAEQ